VNKHTIASLAIFILAAGIGGAATPVQTVAPARKTTAPAGARAKLAPKPDAEIEQSIKARMAASKISSHHFQVHVQHGVATLEGKTDVLQHKGTATRLAKSAGATQVVNHIEVSQSAKEKAAKNLATGRRRAQIKRGEITARSEKRSVQKGGS
jgi:osmotically-inducible protein OsmY